MADAPRVFEVRNSRDSQEEPAAMEQAFAALGSGAPGQPLLNLLLGRGRTRYFSFEYASIQTRIHLYITVPNEVRSYVENQMTAHYPKIVIEPADDYVGQIFSLPHALGQLVLSKPFYIPFKTHADTRGPDLLAGVLGQLARTPAEDVAAVHFRMEPAGTGWRRTAETVLERGVVDPVNPERTKSHPQARLIERKMSQVGFWGAVRVAYASPGGEAHARRSLEALAGSFGVYTLGEGNSLVLSFPRMWEKKGFRDAFEKRGRKSVPRFQVFGSSELASMWHPPGMSLSMIKNISWGAKLTGEPPEDLPVYSGPDSGKKAVNFFARTEYKNKSVTFGIKKEDRRKHLYIIGKTGTGKSTCIANMAINDMRNGEGLAVIDPHGDLSDIVLDYVPSYRINDVAYLDPSDTDFPFHINPLEILNDSYKEIVASGIVSIFYKLYHYSWGPRLEYILRNSLLTLLALPDSTLLLVPELLTNDAYREKVVEKLDDTVLKSFWINEYGKMSEKMKSEAVSPILNKVGQFLSSRTIRTILGKPRSTIHLEKMMDEGKILIVNLSQGKLGEDNSALLGAMIITKIQLAAMNRVHVAEEDRRDFYLYVDEFQNFATSSFIKILSEARKYRLSLTLANQYIGQIDEDVQKAIFGNAGSLISFGVGARDGHLLSKEFGDAYKPEELVELGNYHTVLKLSIDNHTSRPFGATTLPLPASRNQNREKVIRSSRERYAKQAKNKQDEPPA